MGDSHAQIPVPPRPSLVDVVELRQVEFPLPAADEAWHRLGKSHTSQPIAFEAYTRERGIYEKTAHAAGLRHLRWLSAKAPDDPELDYTDLLRCPPLAAFEVFRPQESL